MQGAERVDRLQGPLQQVPTESKSDTEASTT